MEMKKSKRVKFSTNAASAKYWRRLGWKVEIIQTVRGMFRYDPFGLDLLAIKGAETMGIQACRTGSDYRKHLPHALAAAKEWCYAGVWKEWDAQGNITISEPLVKNSTRKFCLQAWRGKSKGKVRTWTAETYFYDVTSDSFVLQEPPAVPSQSGKRR